MRILIVDDDALVCSSLKTILEAKNIQVDAIGNSGEEAIANTDNIKAMYC